MTTESVKSESSDPATAVAATGDVNVDESSSADKMPSNGATGPASTTASDMSIATTSSTGSGNPSSSSTTTASKSTGAGAKGGAHSPSKTSPSAYGHSISAKGAPHLPPVPMHHPYAHHHYYAYHQHMAAANAGATDPKKTGANSKSSNPVPVPPYNPAQYKKQGVGGESAANRGKQPTGVQGQPPPPPMYPPHLPGHHHAYQAWAAYRYAQQHAQYHGGPPPPPPPGPPPPWNAEAYAAAHQAYAAAVSKAVATSTKGNKSKGSPGEKGGATTSGTATSLIPPPPPMYPPPPPPHTGPYRFSDCTLRREALARSVAEGVAKRKSIPSANGSSKTSSPQSSIPSLAGSPSTPISSLPKNGVIGGPMMHSQSPQDAATLHMMELEARAEGATSPSQIEDFHKEEVATMGCTCKKTKCLKLYCQCFAVKIYCGTNCRCLSCSNNAEHESERQDAIRTILARNPTAFDTKFQKNNRKMGPGITGPGAIMSAAANGGVGGRAGGILGSMDIPHQRSISHKVGCKCRKSACMKKYCECYASNVKCSANCRCVGCKNMPLGGFGSSPGATSAAVVSETTMPVSAKSTPTKTVMTTPVKKEPSWMMNAAHNLAFLKHGSAEKPKRIISRAPSESGSMAGSMPSLASSSEESPIGGANKTRANANGVVSMPMPSSAEREAVNALKSSEKTAVNALLMAAMAMTEMSGLEQNTATDKNENRHDSSTTNDANGTSSGGPTSPLENRENSNTSSPEATIRTADEHFETPQRNLFKKFLSPKRKVGDRNAETGPPTHTVPAQSPARNLVLSNGYAESENDEEDSPKREHPGDGTPIVRQKIKRSRLGSLQKGARLLEREKSNGDQDILETTSATIDGAMPMEMATPAKDTTGGVKIADLTPVSARCIDFKKMRVNDSSSDPAVVDSVAL